MSAKTSPLVLVLMAWLGPVARAQDPEQSVLPSVAEVRESLTTYRYSLRELRPSQWQRLLDAEAELRAGPPDPLRADLLRKALPALKDVLDESEQELRDVERRLQQLGELDRRRAQEEERRIRHGDRVPLPPGICRSARTIFTIAQGESRCFTPS